MVASTFGAAFDRLPHAVQREYSQRMVLRRKNYCAGLAGTRWSQCRAIIVGDRPGNGAQKLPANHHHTPFYSTKNSSLWMNTQLIEAGIHENDLFWMNSADLNGVPSSPTHLEGWNDPQIIALGGNASSWLEKHNKFHIKVFHPQAWKRFHSSKPYPLIEQLKNLLDLNTG